MTSSKIALLDTNILVYAADDTTPFHQDAKALRDKGLNGELDLCVCPQVLFEFYSIVTDPKRVLYTRTRKEAMHEVEKYLDSRNILKIYPRDDITGKVLNLLGKYDITKQNIFDLILVATMLINVVTTLYTYDKKDFSIYSEIEALKP